MVHSTKELGTEKIFAPNHIGRLELKNRIIMAPMETNLPSIHGEVNGHVIDYYKERAKGGVGAIIVEFTCVDAPVGKGTNAQLVIDHNKFIPGHTYLAEEIQKYDCRAILQLHHAGRQTHPSITEGQQPVAPSPITCQVMKSEPKQLTTEEVQDIVKKFVRGAVRASNAGYDGVELHAAHGYLLGSFLSPYTNKRTDQYGGTTENRTRILREIIEGIKGKLGDYPVIVRFSADEFVESGLKIQESMKIAQYLEEYGADALHVSTGIFETNDKNIDPMSAKQGWRIPLARTIKESVSIPVIGVGVIREPSYAKQVIDEGYVDFVALGRALLADPEWVNKAQSQNDAFINRCTTCGYCTDRLAHHQSVRCAVNPRAGREYTTPELTKAERTEKTVHVIGGGSTGMNTAVFAAKRGFKVNLYERSSQLGGLLDTAGAAPDKENWFWFKEYLMTQINESNLIEVYLNSQMTDEDLEDLPTEDYVIDATGMVPRQSESLSKMKIPVYTVEEAMHDESLIDKNIVVLGSRGAGLEAAHLFATNNNQVVVLARSNKQSNGQNIDRINRTDLLQKLKHENVSIFNECDVFVNIEGQLECIDVKSQKPIDINMTPHVIVTARGFNSNKSLDSKRTIKVGGSRKPGKILEGVWQGYVVVSQLT